MDPARGIETFGRCHQAAAELERFARWMLFRAADAAAKEQAQRLLRHAIGCRRVFERRTDDGARRRP